MALLAPTIPLSYRDLGGGSPLFDADHYLGTTPDVVAGGGDRLAHFLAAG